MEMIVSILMVFRLLQNKVSKPNLKRVRSITKMKMNAHLALLKVFHLVFNLWQDWKTLSVN